MNTRTLQIHGDPPNFRKMRNPWLDLPKEPPYVLPQDREYVDEFNRHTANPKYQLDVALMPGPFEGSRQAPLLVLMRNPGVGSWDDDRELGDYQEAMRANLGDAPEDQVQVGLKAEFESTPAGIWSRGRCFKNLIKEQGLPAEHLAHLVLNVEFHGYHSKNWHSLPITLPSQYYGFWLVVRAMERGATVVALRGSWDWEVAVPGLADYPRLVTVHSSQSPAISPDNCGDKFSYVLEALGSSVD
ncbi:MAG TPA: hypothetical protein VGC49_12605 [Solirubrobacterales bacterium]|jgi:hypothetical protein